MNYKVKFTYFIPSVFQISLFKAGLLVPQHQTCGSGNTSPVAGFSPFFTSILLCFPVIDHPGMMFVRLAYSPE